MLHALIISFMLLLIPGCAGSPSMPVAGAYFPDWVFCSAGGVALAVMVKAILACWNAERAFGPPVIAYPLLALLFSLLIWLTIFKQ